MILAQTTIDQTFKILTPAVKDWIILAVLPSLGILVWVLLNNFLRSMTKKSEEILKRIDYLVLDDTARDMALNDLLPKNGKGYLDLKRYYRENLNPESTRSIAKK